MKITEAIAFFTQAEKNAEKKSQKKHYTTFIAILSDLHTKNLDENQFLSIEKELDNFKLNSKTTFKELNRSFSKFKQFLKVKFSFTTEGYYTSLGIGLGLCFGIAFGSLIDRIIGSSIGMTFGMLIGIVVGKKLDSDAEIHGRALKTKLQN
jgi:hypothetical protein